MITISQSFIPGKIFTLFVTAGGLLFTSDSVNMQYTATATLLLFIYSKTLSSSGSGTVQCSGASFSPDQIRSFAASQVRNTSSSHMFSGFCQIYCTASDTLAVFRWITSWGTIQWACPTWSASAPSSQGAFTTVAHRSRPSRLCQGRSLAMRGSRHGSRQATRTRTSMSVLLLADLMGMTSSLITGGIPHTPSRQHTSTQRLWVPVLLLWGRTRCRGLWVTSRQ